MPESKLLKMQKTASRFFHKVEADRMEVIARTMYLKSKY
jgi:hypothetical protein